MRSRYRPPQPRQTALACSNGGSLRCHAFNTTELPRPEHPLPRRGAYV